MLSNTNCIFSSTSIRYRATTTYVSIKNEKQTSQGVISTWGLATAPQPPQMTPLQTSRVINLSFLFFHLGTLWWLELWDLLPGIQWQSGQVLRRREAIQGLSESGPPSYRGMYYVCGVCGRPMKFCGISLISSSYKCFFTLYMSLVLGMLVNPGFTSNLEPMQLMTVSGMKESSTISNFGFQKS